MIKPTIGRKVWFWTNGSKIGAPGAKQPWVDDATQALDATVVQVLGDRMVNLLVVDHGGQTHPIRSVTLLQHGDPAPKAGMYCEWMPYQASQAEKHAAAVATTMSAVATQKLTRAYIESRIIHKHFDQMPGSTVTVCMLELVNGAKVIGHNYGSIDPDAQDWDVGRKAAFEMAVDKVWELEGYLLRERLFSAGPQVKFAPLVPPSQT